MPVLFIIGLLIFLAGYIVFYDSKRVIVPSKKLSLKTHNEAQNLAVSVLRGGGINTMGNELQEWNKEKISGELVRLQADQPLFRSYIKSLKNQFVDNQNTNIASSRIGYLQKQIEMLGLANQYADVQKELLLKKHKFDNEKLRLELENQQIALDFRDAEEEKEIQKLENLLRKEQLKKQISDLTKEPEEPPKQLTAEEIREKKRQDLKSRIQKINQMIEEVKNDPAMGDHERQTQLNQLERKKFDLNDQLLELI